MYKVARDRLMKRQSYILAEMERQLIVMYIQHQMLKLHGKDIIVESSIFMIKMLLSRKTLAQPLPPNTNTLLKIR